MTSAAAQSEDALTRFAFERAAVRGGLVRLSDTVHAIVRCHPYPRALAQALADLLAAAALLASTLKFTGSLTVQLQGDGPVRLLVVECSDTLDLRATAQWDAARMAALPAEATLAELAGGPAHGRLTITLDPKGAAPLYQGIVALESGSVAGLIEHYLMTSEQLDSRMVLTSDGGRAAGMILQRMPGAGEEDDLAWQRACESMAAIDRGTLLRATLAEAVLESAFPEVDLRVFDARPARFHCTCSRERVENALMIAGREEIEAILAERKDIEVTCEFCNHCYVFAPAQARAIVAAAPEREPGS